MPTVASKLISNENVINALQNKKKKKGRTSLISKRMLKGNIFIILFSFPSNYSKEMNQTMNGIHFSFTSIKLY